MNNEGLLLVISAPSGCGKDTVISSVLEKMENDAYLSVSMTTRGIRPGEQEGINYYYVTEEEFFRNVNEGNMLEYARYGSNYYGTPVKPVKKLMSEGKVVILIIEVEGGGNVRKTFPEAVKVFIMPPSMQVLENRLRGRNTDSEQAILDRLEIAKKEMERAVEYDYKVVNDKLETAVTDVLAIIRAERLKIKNMKNKLREVVNNA